MEGFNQNFNGGENQNFDNLNNVNQNEHVNNKFDDQPMWNKVEFTPIEKVESNKSLGVGLKVFCAVMAGVMLLTATAAGGYFMGKKNATVKKPESYVGKKVEVDLEKKPTDVDPNAPAKVYADVNESIVGIRIYNQFYDSSATGRIPPEASGVIYSEDGYIVTNDHIYNGIGAAKFKIFMHDGREYDAVYVAGDVISDLAVLKIVESDEKFKPAVFGDSDELVNGEQVVAIGRPSGATDDSSITMGVISLTRRRVKGTTSYSVAMIQTDSAINPGSSGGALINMYGQVVGITSSKIAGEEYDAIGFAIPTRTMKRVVEQLILNGKVTDRAKLGISYTEFDSIKAEIMGYDCVGLYVGEVSKDSDVFGTVTKGDIITHVNGIEITDDDIMLDIIEESQPGDKISITVLFKDNKQAELEVTLKENIGESSYMTDIKDIEKPDEKEFNFPEGD